MSREIKFKCSGVAGDALGLDSIVGVAVERKKFAAGSRCYVTATAAGAQRILQQAQVRLNSLSLPSQHREAVRDVAALVGAMIGED